MPGWGQKIVAHTTTCTSCGTTFRVTAEQLLARDGNVRCGRCNHVFNAHSSLALDYPPMPASVGAPAQEENLATTEFAAPDQPTPSAVAKLEDESWWTEPEPEPEPEPVTVLARTLNAAPQASQEMAEAPQPEFLDVPIPEAEHHPALSAELAPDFGLEPTFGSVAGVEPDPAFESATDFAPDAAALRPDPPNTSESDNALEALAQNLWKEAIETPAAPLVAETAPAPDARSETRREMPPEAPPVTKSPAQPRNFRWLWPVGSTLLMLGLLAQSVLYFRTELAAFNPALRPALEQVCTTLGCRVALPQNPDLLSIETSSLEADPNHADVVVLHAVPRNRAPYAQAYPVFELTLTDYQDKPLARRLFQPQEYLPQGTPLQMGMPANEEVDVKLTIDLGETKAAGYRVYLFYPSAAS